MKLYVTTGGPPSLAVRMVLETLEIPFELISVDFNKGEHMTEDYAKMNPQNEIPVLDDNGFYLSESIAMMQYICNKYRPDSSLYPKDPQQRAIVDQRLCFNMGFYYTSIGGHVVAPIFFDYQRSPMSLKKVHISLAAFEKYLETSNTKYSAGNNLTIADFALVTSTMCLEAINFNFDLYPLIKKWYSTFKSEYPRLWAFTESEMNEITEFDKNLPTLTFDHPIHPIRQM